MTGETSSLELQHLRAEIERDRAALSDTVEQLAHRTNVKARARDAAGHTVDQARQQVDAVRGQGAKLAATVAGRVGAVAQSVRASAHRAELSTKVRRRQLPAAAAAAAAVLLGLVVVSALRRRRG